MEIAVEVKAISGISNCHIGTMGWSYVFWEGNFYPKAMRAFDYLKEYAKHFSTVEIDSSFYRIPPAAMVKNWGLQTPPNFLFSAKFPRDITEVKQFRDAEGETEVFLRNMSLLRDKLGVLLVQMPYDFGPENFSVIKNFLHGLPRGYRYAVEAKNRKWLDDAFYGLLRENGMALVQADHPWMPDMDTPTAEYVYIRWEGDGGTVKGTTGQEERDRKPDIEKWASRIKKYLAEGREVFGYFSKYFSGYSPADAEYMIRCLQD
ncbi:MAG: DUF72 domain-containing protein [Candidatus Methanomethylicus sp.]|nr:DUF72 domain-containing protein [Candidatus Methanomethylicus sp.]